MLGLSLSISHIICAFHLHIFNTVLLLLPIVQSNQRPHKAVAIHLFLPVLALPIRIFASFYAFMFTN